MKRRKMKLRWDNIIKDVSGVVLIATALTLITVSCQHTQASATAAEELKKAETEMQLECFKYVEDVPLTFELQTYINNVCLRYEIAPEIVFSMIAKESDYNANEIGDNGDSEGLMQVQKKHHKPRMERLGCTNLLNPYENVLVGVDYLAELIDQYDSNIKKALTAYNAGPTGAYEDYFSHGIEASEYAEAVIENSKKIDEGAILVFFRTDDPARDAERNDAEKEEELKKMPKCSHDNQPIQDGYLFDIEGELYCEEHAYELFRKDTADYVES